jgi:hypothetical protein
VIYVAFNHLQDVLIGHQLLNDFEDLFISLVEIVENEMKLLAEEFHVKINLLPNAVVYTKIVEGIQVGEYGQLLLHTTMGGFHDGCEVVEDDVFGREQLEDGSIIIG